MPDDPRAFFRLPPRNCSTCEHWYHDLMDPREPSVVLPKHESGAVELPCRIHGRAYDQRKNNYENGWRRGSDSCLSWTRRTP